MFAALKQICRSTTAFEKVLIAFAVVFLAHYAATKPQRGVVTFLSTDPEERYLIDKGSYVTNDYVHIDFETFLLPPQAVIELAHWPVGSTNVADCEVAVSLMLCEWPRPFDYHFPAATNHRWFVYTIWTPGPATHTNGVWESYIHAAAEGGAYSLPRRSVLFEDGGRLHPGKEIHPGEIVIETIVDKESDYAQPW